MKPNAVLLYLATSTVVHGFVFTEYTVSACTEYVAGPYNYGDNDCHAVPTADYITYQSDAGCILHLYSDNYCSNLVDVLDSQDNCVGGVTYSSVNCET